MSNVRHAAVDEPSIVPTSPWWTSTPWCTDGACHGGETFVFQPDGPTVTAPRMHYGTLVDEPIAHIDGGDVAVKVEVTAVEDRTDGYLDPPAVAITVDGPLLTDPDTAERIARGILAAVAAARQPIAAAAFSVAEQAEVTR